MPGLLAVPLDQGLFLHRMRWASASHAALAWMLLREPLPATFVLSSALVLSGVWMTQMASGAVRPPRTAGR